MTDLTTRGFAASPISRHVSLQLDSSTENTRGFRASAAVLVRRADDGRAPWRTKATSAAHVAATPQRVEVLIRSYHSEASCCCALTARR